MSTWRPFSPPPGEQEPKKLSELLDRTTKRLGGPSSGTSSTVFSRWEQVVGPEIAGHARPVSVREGTLVLAVDHPAWATQLRYMTSELLTRISEASGTTEVCDIQIRVAGDPRPRSPGRTTGRATARTTRASTPGPSSATTPVPPEGPTEGPAPGPPGSPTRRGHKDPS